MKNHGQDNLRALFERFMPPAEAEAAATEVRAADDMLQAYPAPEPDAETIIGIKLQLGTALSGRRKASHPVYRFVGAAAAVIAIAMLGYFGRAPDRRPDVRHAALIPTVIWESDDISSDDMEIAYFASEIQQIEAQMQALQAGEGENAGVSALDDVEMELMRINTEFWKE